MSPGPPSRPRTSGRLFLTCWLVFSLHVATDMVRENYLALAIGDHASFRVDAYAGLHDDLFLLPGRGWHIMNNPGASMLAAIPYAVARPVIDPIVERVRADRRSGERAHPPAYDARNPTDRHFYAEAWRRGLDVKFGLASVVMQSLCMAVISALGVVVMYLVLADVFGRPRTAFALALLYAFGTPVFLRTGFVNQNMMMATAGWIGFAALGGLGPWRGRCAGGLLLGGLAGGLCVLLDYSGVVLLLGLGAYGAARARREGGDPGLPAGLLRYALGAALPLALLAFYQWRSFGNPWLPAQHWVSSMAFVGQGYRGLSPPSLELAGLLLFDFRYGLVPSCPLFLLALGAPFVKPEPRERLSGLALGVASGLVLALVVFFSAVPYTRWQFHTGVRYLAPAFPFLFLLTARVLIRLPRPLAFALGALAIAQAWCMAMVRDVSGGKVELGDPDTGRGVLDPVLRVLAEGPQLPALTTLSRMEAYADLPPLLLSPWPYFAAAALLLYALWRPRRRAVGA